MTVTQLRFAKSQTRDLADRDRVTGASRSFDDQGEWRMTNAGFVTALGIILGALALFALYLRLRG